MKTRTLPFTSRSRFASSSTARLSLLWMLFFLLFGTLAVCAQATEPPEAPLTAKDGKLLLHGKPYQILSGEIHYARIPREYWRARLKLAKAMGLNTISTYVFWNVHEPKPGVYDFSGNLDVAEFIRIAQQEGLNVILRPGPYVCAEWDLGGYPAWLIV